MASPATYRPARPPYPSSSPTASSSSSLPPLPPPPPSKYDYSDSPRGSGEERRPWSGSNGGRDTPEDTRGGGGGGGSGDGQPQKSSNPLVDLIESEKRYVEELGAVIRVSLPFSYTSFELQKREERAARRKEEEVEKGGRRHPRDLLLSEIAKQS